MSIRSKRVCFSPDVNEKPAFFLKHGGDRGGRVLLGNRKRIIGNWSFRVAKDPRLSPVRFLLRLGAKVARATIKVVSMRRRSSRKVSSSSNLVRSRSLSDPTDSHRAEAVEDCIEFLHSSSSRERPLS
ncbi:josephin-like protein [Senna tora]|uniref:Josephin-like protein n=1 Tax=Senna tora TaxID=362788 RepID=A0A834XHK8_9FABA|nr:josephin-like protein [Senna tora]